MKKYKYSRKDWLDYYEDLEHMHITKEAKEDLLAKESNEEYSQRIMMEQVPNNGNGGGFIATNFKQEDNKDQRYVYCCPVHGEYYKVCPKCNPTPSPLEEHKWLYELKDWKDFTLDELEFEIFSIIRHWKEKQK